MIPDKPPFNGPSEQLNIEFRNWWFFLNSIGVFSLTAAIGIHGSEHSAFKALVIFFLISWMYWIGRYKFPSTFLKLRRSKEKVDRDLVKQIDKEYLGGILFFFRYFAFIVGTAYLGMLWLVPIACEHYQLFLPW